MNWYKKSQQLEITDMTDNPNSKKEYTDIAHDLYYRTQTALIDNPNYLWVYTNGIIDANPETMDQPSHRFYPQWNNINYEETYVGRYSPSTKTITIVRPMGVFQFREIPSHLKMLLQQKFPEAQKLSIHASAQRWYKKAQYNNPPEWNFPEAEHDYNPNWDYDIDPIPDEKLVQIAEKAMNEINNKIISQIGMGKAKAAYIKNDNEDRLAIYAFGTAPYPVFMINLENIKKVAEQCAKDLYCNSEQEIIIGISTSLYHELGHAIQDWMNINMDENEAEEFARHYNDFGEIWKFWE